MSMIDDEVDGYFLLGQNPAVGSAHGKLQRLGLSHLKWLVVRDLNMIESTTFWKDSPEIETGELRCIIGPNGAGKTTMMDIITGKTRPDTGSAWFGQRIDLLKLSEPEIAQAGIGRNVFLTFKICTISNHCPGTNSDREKRLSQCGENNVGR